MSSLNVIPGLPPEAIEQLTSCGIESAEMLGGIPPAQIHRVLELTAWQKGKLNRAPTLDMVHHWAQLARGACGMTDSDAALAAENIPEAIIGAPMPLPPRSGYVSPSQRALLAAAGPPAPAAPPAPFPQQIKPSPSIPAAHATTAWETGAKAAAAPLGNKTGTSGFNSFEDYQAGITRVTPLSRHSIDEPGEHLPIDRINVSEELSRTVRRGVVHPSPGLLIFGAVISLVWRVALVAAIISVPWLYFAVERPSEYAPQIFLAAGILAVLGVAQMVVIGRARCRVCSCHLFFSRNCVKNRKAHSIPGLGKTASLALHLLLFQWFRCMYCGTAIKLWASKGERDGAP